MSSQGASEGALPEERGGEGSFLAVAEPVFSYRSNIVYLYITLLKACALLISLSPPDI